MTVLPSPLVPPVPRALPLPRALSLLLAAVLAFGCTRVDAPPRPAPRDLPPAGVTGGGGAGPPPPGYTPPAAPSAPSAPPPPAFSEPPAFVTRPEEGPLPGLTLPPETGNVRALWVVRTALTHPDSARVAVRRARDAGFNTLLVQVRGRGDAYYDSLWEPWPDALAGSIADYDPLATVLDEAHRLGLRVHAWVNVHLVASATLPPRDSRHIARSRPELLAVPRSLALDLFHMDPRDPRYLDALIRYTLQNGSTVEGIYTNPSHPRVQDHLHFVVTDLIERYPLDGIHLDYIRFPSPDFDFSRGSLESFRGWMRIRGHPQLEGAEHLWGRDPLAYASTFPEQWDEFRREQLTNTMERLYRSAKRARSGTVVSAAVFADADDARGARYQDWEAWLRDGIVDVVAPMAYTLNGGVFEAQIARAVAIDPRRVWAGLGIYQDTFQGAIAKGRAALGMGVGGVALFSYDWAAGPEGTRAAGGSYLTRYAAELWGR